MPLCAETHLARLEKSAANARIPLPFSRETMIEVCHHPIRYTSARPLRTCARQIIARTCAISGRHDAAVRYWLTAGPGDFGIVPAPNAEACFYVLVFAGLPLPERPPLVLASLVAPALVRTVGIACQTELYQPAMQCNAKCRGAATALGRVNGARRESARWW
jgi:hypothetical protein